MRNLLSRKLKSKRGFTLAELLIVVAIIAVLVAIMIPVFGSSRASAIEAKDAANVRAAYAEAVTKAMAEGKYEGTNLKVAFKVPTDKGEGTTVKYDTSNHVITVKNSGTSGTGIPIKIDTYFVWDGEPGFDS